VAVVLQQAILPTRTPNTPGLHVVARYQPASAGHQVGGGWYDIIPPASSPFRTER
jgi:serine phosphatase RsbU (regulator of sigma subunit)